MTLGGEPMVDPLHDPRLKGLRKNFVFIKAIPVFDSDANELGEYLRSVTFVGKGYGGVSNFDVRPDSTVMPHAWARVVLEDGFHDESLDDDAFHGCTFTQDGLQVGAYWYWEGDGTLLFRIYAGTELLRKIVNSDCKKDHVWEDVPFSETHSSSCEQGPNHEGPCRP